MTVLAEFYQFVTKAAAAWAWAWLAIGPSKPRIQTPNIGLTPRAGPTPGAVLSEAESESARLEGHCNVEINYIHG